MDWFHRLHSNTCPPGLERRIWRRLPLALAAGVAVPLALSVGTRLYPPGGSSYEIARTTASVDIFAIALLLTAITAVITVGVGCVVVMIMKGPAYVADGDRPGTRVPLEPDDD